MRYEVFQYIKFWYAGKTAFQKSQTNPKGVLKRLLIMNGFDDKYKTDNDHQNRPDFIDDGP